MNPDQEVAYRTASELYNKELDRLFQRVNFFLIGSSFLIVAFVTLLRGSLYFGSIHYVLFYLVNMTGFLLSLFFTITNFRMARFLANMLDYLYGLENPETTKPLCPKDMFPYHRTKRFGNDLKRLGFRRLGLELAIALVQLVCRWCPPCKKYICTKLSKRTYRRLKINLSKKYGIETLGKLSDRIYKRLSYEDGLVAEHTWLVPFGFIHFWWLAALLTSLFRHGIFT